MKARTACIYAESGLGKSTQLYFMALWLWFNFKLKTHLISYDGKYASFQLPNPRLGGESLISAKIVRLFDATISPTGQMFADSRKLSEGYWPRYTKEGDMYFKAEEKCRLDFSDIGMYAIDGLSSYEDRILSHAVSTESGFKASYAVEEDGYEIKGGQDGHYGIAQKEAQDVWKGKGTRSGYHNLPVKYVITTALVEKGTENFRRKRAKRNDPNAPAELNVTTMYGPKAAGQALTPFLPGWFDDCFHLDRVGVKVPGKDEPVIIRAAYYEDHLHEQTDVPYKCRVDILPEEVGNLRKKFPHGFVPLELTKGIDKFYEFVMGNGREEKVSVA